MTSKQHTYANFGEYIYWSYANLQMLHYAVTAGKRKYDRTCYMIRANAFKAYKEGRWNIHDLLAFNVAKIQCQTQNIPFPTPSLSAKAMWKQ